ncbi:MAG: arylsulfatase [Planctomycetia bacterium]|nr:arylsulfatase [Planctomycetia bacterium]
MRLQTGFVLCGLFLIGQASLNCAEHNTPNIIFILADDIGYGDVSSYGATHAKTPNIDRLAREGRRFTDAHSPASTCTPTRAALLTGRYSWRQQPGSSIAPGDASMTIQPGTTTIPSVLKEAGYTTGVVGKWHLGFGGEAGPDWNADLKPGPLEIGFDDAFLMPATGDRVPCVYVKNHRVVGLDLNDPIRVSYKMKIGDEPTGKENPELLTLKHTHGHDMTIVNGVGRIGWMTGGKTARWKDEDMADTFAKAAIGFIESSQSQQKKKPFFLYLATHGIHVPRVPHPRFKGTSSVGTRGDAIHELDDTVGQVLAAVDRLKLTDSTLIIFTSDNGGVMDDGYEDVGKFDYHPNGTLRGTKGTLFEGGHRVPFLARWPGRITASSECDTLITHLDMIASFAALTGVTLPKEAAADSFNVLQTLLGETPNAPPRPHFVAHVGGIHGPFAIRQGDWKFIQPGGGGRQAEQSKKDLKASQAGQLFNLKEDVAEKTNLVATHPEKVAELQALMKQLREQGRSRL